MIVPLKETVEKDSRGIQVQLLEDLFSREPFQSEDDRLDFFKKFYVSLGHSTTVPFEVCNAVHTFYNHNIAVGPFTDVIRGDYQVGRLPGWVKKDDRLLPMGQRVLTVHRSFEGNLKKEEKRKRTSEKIVEEIRDLRKVVSSQEKTMQRLVEEVVQMRREQAEETKELKQMIMFTAGYSLIEGRRLCTRSTLPRRREPSAIFPR